MRWIQKGDSNTFEFHRAIKERKMKSNVYGISAIDGTWADTPRELNEAFLKYYKGLLELQVK